VRAGILAGRTVMVTRAAADSEQWARRLRRLGAHPVVFPCLVSEVIGDAETAERLASAVRDADWLILQSARAADAAARLLRGIALSARIAAVGPSTGTAARRCLGRVDLIAAERSSAGLAGELLGRLKAESCARVVIAAAEEGRDDAERILAAAGIRVTRVNVYRTIPSPPAHPRRDLLAEGVDTVLLASPSAVTGLMNRAVPAPAVRVVTIGPTTSAAARAAGLVVTAEARNPDLDSIVEAMV